MGELIVIVTCRSLLWILLSLATFLLLVSSLAHPAWLVGPRLEVNVASKNSSFSGGVGRVVHHRHDSLGLYNKCVYRKKVSTGAMREVCLARSFSRIAHPAWQAAIVLLGVVIVLTGVAALFAIATFCKQIAFKKSLFHLARLVHALAAILMVIVLVLYPAGWGNNTEMQDVCYRTRSVPAKAFKMSLCSLGLSFYFALAGTLGAIFSALIANFADSSVFSSTVQDEILEGRSLITAW